MTTSAEVSSGLHNVQRCLTVGGLSASRHVSHDEACTLLLQSVRSTDSYQVTTSVVNTSRLTCKGLGGQGLGQLQSAKNLSNATDTDDENHAMDVDKDDANTHGIPETVFRLVTDTCKGDALATRMETAENDETLVAVAWCPPDTDSGVAVESVATAHERDMAQLRDGVADGSLALHRATRLQDAIRPAPGRTATLAQQVQATADAVAAAESNMPAASKPASTTLLRGPKKATTAASFFAKSEKQKQSTTTTKSKTTATKPKGKTATATTKTSSKPKSKPAPAAEDEKENTAQRRITDTTAVEKKKPTSTATTKKTVGTADDFVGDMDDDDDDSVMQVDEDLASQPEEQPVPPSPPLRNKRASSKKPARSDPTDDDDDDEDEKPKVRGAMDAFAVETKKPIDAAAAGTKKKRQRKTMETRTYSDKQGYLHTETVEVWKDIPSDEEEKVVVAAPSKPATKKASAAAKTNGKGGGKAQKSNMKQKSLASFFGKKK